MARRVPWYIRTIFSEKATGPELGFLPWSVLGPGVGLRAGTGARADARTRTRRRGPHATSLDEAARLVCKPIDPPNNSIFRHVLVTGKELNDRGGDRHKDQPAHRERYRY